MYDPSAVFYMDKLVSGPDAASSVDISAPVEHNVRAVAKSLGGRNTDVTVCILDRPRHRDLIEQVRATGARTRLIADGDVAGALAAAIDGSGIDLLIGTGGTPEGIIAACAMKALGGAIQAQLHPMSEDEARKAVLAGHDLHQVLPTDDLVRGDNAFFAATGITDGELLKGVRYTPEGAVTQSLVMRARSGTVRRVESSHSLEKVQLEAGEET